MEHKDGTVHRRQNEGRTGTQLVLAVGIQPKNDFPWGINKRECSDDRQCNDWQPRGFVLLLVDFFDTHGKSFFGLLNGFWNPEKAFSMGTKKPTASTERGGTQPQGCWEEVDPIGNGLPTISFRNSPTQRLFYLARPFAERMARPFFSSKS